MMKAIAGVRSFFYRIPFVSGSYCRAACRSFCEGKPRSSKNGSGNGDPNTAPASSSSSLTTYDEQYKALGNLDFMTATRILFSDKPKKKFGLDFHLVQLFFACLPSLAVYLVALYARSEMRRMDAELEKRKQAEFEAQTKEMERKAAEDKSAVASNPAILEVKERLDKLEVTLKEILEESRKQPSDDSLRNGKEQHKHGAQLTPPKAEAASPASNGDGSTVSAQQKANEAAP